VTLPAVADFTFFPVSITVRKFMAQDYRREVAERVVHDMDIGAAHSAKCDLNLNLVIPALRFRDISNIQISFALCVLQQCLHQNLRVHSFGQRSTTTFLSV
jgi:hypothetical protein